MPSQSYPTYISILRESYKDNANEHLQITNIPKQTEANKLYLVVLGVMHDRPHVGLDVIQQCR